MNDKNKILLIILLCLTSFSLNANSVMEVSHHQEYYLKAAQNPEIFNDFKRLPNYSIVFENVDSQTGWKYLNAICEENPSLISLFNQFRVNDSIGNPNLANYNQFGWFSPTTLRFMRVAGDLKKKFGDLSNLHIVEIGGGYGGQCTIISAMGGFASYTIVDIPECLELSKKYLELQGITNVSLIDKNKLQNLPNYDLLISNYQFSEMDKSYQQYCLDNLIKKVPRGYMCLNFISHLFGIESLALEDIVSSLYQEGWEGSCLLENPSTHDHNVTLTWRHKSHQYPESKQYPPFLRNGVTYTLSGGRLGDNLLAFLHAKWISYKYQIPLLYKPFPFSEKFAMNQLEQHHNQDLPFSNQIILKREIDLQTIQDNSLYTVSYFPESIVEMDMQKLWYNTYFRVDWEDPEFKKEIRTSLKILESLPKKDLPRDKITIALHVRTGGGIDSPNSHHVWPLKFPPLDYYVAQLKKMRVFFPNQNLYVYLFTDDQNPRLLITHLKSKLKDSGIQFDWRDSGNHPNFNILEDFFDMTQFDCIIRSESNYSLVASKIADYKLVINPARHHFENNNLYIDQVEITFKP